MHSRWQGSITSAKGRITQEVWAYFSLVQIKNIIFFHTARRIPSSREGGINLHFWRVSSANTTSTQPVDGFNNNHRRYDHPDERWQRISKLTLYCHIATRPRLSNIKNSILFRQEREPQQQQPVYDGREFQHNKLPPNVGLFYCSIIH